MNKRQKRLGNKGFSLVELIVVIAIMAVLVAVLAPTLIGKIEESRESSDLSTVTEIKTQVTNMLANEEIYDAVVSTSAKEYILTADLKLTESGSTDDKANGELTNVLEPFKFQSKKARQTGATVKVRINEKGKVYVLVTSSASESAAITLSDGKPLSSGNVITVTGEPVTEESSSGS